MSMRKSTIHACTLGVTLTSTLLASANAATWNGSYAAEGECFCVGSQGREIDSKVIPTPVGGQSVAQVCDRIGSGPELQKVNGKFNYPVYADAQCGHGPFSSASGNADGQCIGHLGVAGEDCNGIGPKWDVKSAYARPPAIEQEAVKQGISETQTATQTATGVSRYILPPVTTTSTASSANSTDSNLDDLNSSEPLDIVADVSVEEDVSVAEIVQTRSESVDIVQAAPQTPEEIRARQLVQMEEARQRLNLQAGLPALQHLEIIKTEEQLAREQASQPATAEAEAEVAAATEEAVESSSETLAQSTATDPVTTAATLPGTSSALKLPIATRNSAREFDYVEGMPVTYDFGGAGMRVGASISGQQRMQYFLQASEAESYREALIGVGLFISPRNADRLTVLLSTGIEYGKFEFGNSALGANLSETGAHLSLSSRFVVNNKFELQAGVGYSSFFEGDAIVFGSAFYHLTPNLDLTTKAEGGDNDSLGFGIRYYY